MDLVKSSLVNDTEDDVIVEVEIRVSVKARIQTLVKINGIILNFVFFLFRIFPYN